MLKRIIAILFIMILFVGLCSCSSEPGFIGAVFYDPMFLASDGTHLYDYTFYKNGTGIRVKPEDNTTNEFRWIEKNGVIFTNSALFAIDGYAIYTGKYFVSPLRICTGDYPHGDSFDATIAPYTNPDMEYIFKKDGTVELPTGDEATYSVSNDLIIIHKKQTSSRDFYLLRYDGAVYIYPMIPME